MVIGIFSHDSGGAEILSSYLKEKKIKAEFCIKGPAIKIFKEKIRIKKILPLNEVIKNSSSILCSTSGLSDLEYIAIKEAKKKGIKSVAILDHWINYRERFIRNNKTIIPDEIWLTDKYGLEISKKIFKKTKLKLIKNYYFIDFKKKYKKIKYNKNTDNKKILLYLCEPIANHCFSLFDDKYYYGYTEFESMTYFFKNIIKVLDNISKIIIRLHPSENINKYDKIINEFNHLYDIKISTNNKLHNDIRKSDIVFGCETMAMYFAKMLNKRVISVIPPNGKNSSLPLENLEYLKDILI